MIEYFKGHKDSAVINEYLNALPQDSNDFLVVFCLRKMGEEFVEGKLSLETVHKYVQYIPASQRAEDFIKQMKCHTFYTALCNIALEKPLSPFEQKIKDEIEHPSFCKPIPSTGGWPKIKYKLERIWHSRWKHPLVFNEYWLPALVTWGWGIVRMQKIVKDYS